MEADTACAGLVRRMVGRIRRE
ncbi:uncharacterized protein G2W53_026339 [Senna tora]|uniref:Uncharacterized protein n=1 Tax=Senna tora TaxID=362788 RepID=A0A834TH06_9FABA|nr:uncharacterized protein G2W53_026339 [Senna tora]